MKIRILLSQLVLAGINLSFLTTHAFAANNVGSLHGGLEPAISIERQDVTVNFDQISTTFILVNNSPQEITQTFILPAPMQVTVDGRQIELQSSAKAISNQGKDISNLLTSLGVPFDPITAMHSMDASSNRESVRNKLISLKLLDKGEETPNWTLKIHYYWRQHFAANAKTTITQIYKPTLDDKAMKIKSNNSLISVPGNMLKKLYNLTIKWSLEDPITAKNLQSMLEKANPHLVNYCPGLDDYQAILNSEQQNTNKISALDSKELNYPYLADEIVCTPVNKFSLKIHIPNNMHPIFCWNDGLKKTGKILSFEADHFVPLQNLNILFVAKFEKDINPG